MLGKMAMQASSMAAASRRRGRRLRAPPPSPLVVHLVGRSGTAGSGARGSSKAWMQT